MSFSVLGYGNVGSWAAKLLSERGGRLVAVMDHTGAIRADRGIRPGDLLAHVDATGGVRGYAHADPVDEESFYATRVDLFVAAALEQMIDERRARWLDCRVLAEGANAPTTPAGERLLLDRGVTVLPAILCNAGGVTVSYFEWKQNRMAETWRPDEVDAELKRYVFAAAQRVKLAAHRHECDLRRAAFCAALDRVGRVYTTRGIFP
jgi:glutamate dehydrogenase (NAD(P)+)